MGMIACYQMVEPEQLNLLLEKETDEIIEAIETLQEADTAVLDIDKLWDGLHFLLTKETEPEEGNPLSEAVLGTQIFGDGECVYFTAYILPKRVQEIRDVLRLFNIESVIEQFEPKEFAQNDIYPNIWIQENKEDLQEELTQCFLAVEQFYEQAAEGGKGVIVSIY